MTKKEHAEYERKVSELQTKEREEWNYLRFIKQFYGEFSPEAKEQQAQWCGYYRAMEIMGIPVDYTKN